jgi:hypothetical protein
MSGNRLKLAGDKIKSGYNGKADLADHSIKAVSYAACCAD